MTIGSGVESVSAAPGADCPDPVGAGAGGSCASTDISSLLSRADSGGARIYQSEIDLSKLKSSARILSGTVTGKLAGSYMITIADGATVTLRDVTINGVNSPSYKWAGLTCRGDATINIEGENTIIGFCEGYPGVFVPNGKTLTIQGGGLLAATSNGYAAGIGGGDKDGEGNKLHCGNIDIKSGSIIAVGGKYAAGIGGGFNSSCGTIYIRSDITQVIATRGDGSYTKPIGRGENESSGVPSVAAGLVDTGDAGGVKTRRIAKQVGYLPNVTEDTTFGDGAVLTGTLGGNYKISIADGAVVTLSDVTINGVDNSSYNFAGITCEGDAWIILEGKNTVKGFWDGWPGIFVPHGRTLTILGSGSLTASSNGHGAGIGGGDGFKKCGNIVIESGTVKAVGGIGAAGIGGGDNEYAQIQENCGNISINGGTVEATGGNGAAGIGCGYDGDCGNITIGPDVVSVTATADGDWASPIGSSTYESAHGDIIVAEGLSDVTDADSLTRTIRTGDLSYVWEDTVFGNGTVLSGTARIVDKLSIAAGATVTLRDVVIGDGVSNPLDRWAGLTCLGDATIILEGENFVRGLHDYPGIFVPEDCTLTIKGEGSLEASSEGKGAGIGGGGEYGVKCGNIVIESGRIVATGGNAAAGIGGGSDGSCGDITITGGYVEATGGNQGAGIGTSANKACGDITISGGQVYAIGGARAAGIGGGFFGKCGAITIGAGVENVVATRGEIGYFVDYPALAIGKGEGEGAKCGEVAVEGTLGDEISADGAVRTIAPIVTVMFNANGGTVEPATTQMVSGMSIGEMPEPVWPGYTFDGWYRDPSMYETYKMSATDPVRSDMTLYAKWSEASLPTFQPNAFAAKTLKEIKYSEPSEGGPYTFSVKGLPAGLKFTAKDLAATTKQPAVAANSVYGTPTKPGIYEVTVTAKSATNKKGVTTKVTVVVANLVDSEIPVAGSYGPYIPGVMDILHLTAAEGCSVSGLPSGMKWTAKDVVDSKSKAVVVPANSVYGAPMKPGNYTVTFTKTVNKVKHTATSVFKVSAFPVLVVAKTGSGTGKVTGAGAYAANKVVTLKATADTKDAAATDKKPATKKSVFMGWYLGDTLISQAASLKYTMPEDSTMLKAKFITVAEEAAALSATVGEKYEFAASAPTSKYATVYAGVRVDWPVEIDGVTPTTVAVSGLPAGLKFTAKDIMKKGSKTEVEVPANTIYGAPTAASKIDSKTSQPKPSKVKITLTTAGKSKYVFDLNLTVEPMEEWAVGTFEGVGLDDDHKGIGGDSKGRYLHATFTVAANGKISGKVTTLAGETWTLSAPYFDWFSIYAPLEYTATLFDKSGNPFTLQLKPRYGINSYGFMNVWFGTKNGWIGLDQANWNEEPWKDAAKPLAEAGPLVIPTTDIDGNPGELTLKFASSGKVTYTAKFANYSASGSSSLEHDSNLGSGGAFDAKLTVLLPAKAGKFPGCIKHLLLEWDGTQFTDVHEM